MRMSAEGEAATMAKCNLTMIVTDEQLQELYRIMIDGDQASALAFLQVRLRKKGARGDGGRLKGDVGGARCGHPAGGRPATRDVKEVPCRSRSMARAATNAWS